ncbi:MAG: hypothetical protein HUU21_24890 [Polyangiaceae bacterium]|nr:hypothetical protein [Polyangiaceae bacterium]
MKIRADQINSLATSNEDVFIVNVALFLTQHLPKLVATFDRQGLNARIKVDIAIAAGYGIKSEPDVAKWCYLSLVGGKDFHQAPDIHEFLREPLLSPSAKMDFLMRSLALTLEKHGRGDV